MKIYNPLIYPFWGWIIVSFGLIYIFPVYVAIIGVPSALSSLSSLLDLSSFVAALSDGLAGSVVFFAGLMSSSLHSTPISEIVLLSTW